MDNGENLFELTVRDFTEFAIHIKGTPISLERRPWLHRIYDMPFMKWERMNEQQILEDYYRRKMLLIFGRQSEKCQVETTLLTMGDGTEKAIKDVEVGDRVATMLTDGSHTGTRPVVWKSRRVRKPCVRVTTQLGHTIEVSTTHPIRQWDRWTPAGDIKSGDRVATVRKLRELETHPLPENEVQLLGYLIADGSCAEDVGFTQAPGPVLDHFRELASGLGETWREYEQHGSQALRFSRTGPMHDLVRKYGLLGCRSADKRIPDKLMQLPVEQTIKLLEALWSCDGHVNDGGEGTGYEIVYCSISQKLARQVQTLLWKLGVPSRIRTQTPEAYEGTDRRAYLVHIRTREGIERFIQQLDVLGKPAKMPTADSNDNRDTFPIEITEDIQALYAQRMGPLRGNSLSAHDLRKKPKYPLTRRKLREYVDYFKQGPFPDPDALEAHLDTDLYWDEVVSVEDIGEQWCYDIEVEETHNFVTNGVITHNSTTLGNFLLSLAVLVPYIRMLYVTASNAQMREFSDERLASVINDSPHLRSLVGLYGDRKQGEVQNVQTKKFVNQSKLLLRSVYKSADRVRGIAADGLCIDEIQDVYADDIPVIEETLFRSELDNGPISVYSGTPKTFDNPIQDYWGRHSTKNEFMVKCDGCRKWHTVNSKHIAKDGLRCTQCSKRMNPVDGTAQWVQHGRSDAEWEGFHLCQPIVVHSYANKPEVFARMWNDLLAKKARYSVGKFENEVMGRSYDLGSKPVSYEEVRRCALKDKELVDNPAEVVKQGRTFAGIDWGTGSESFTVLSIWHYDEGGRFALLFAKRYQGEESDPDYATEDIIKWCRIFRCTRIGTDWGFGFVTNKRLMAALGAAKVVQVQYVGSQAEKVSFDKKAFTLRAHRTRVMADAFQLIKWGPKPGKNGCAFVNWDQFETFANDILAIYQEMSDRSKQLKYDHPRGVPDDFFHTFVLAFLVSQTVIPRHDISAPGFGTEKKKASGRAIRQGRPF